MTMMSLVATTSGHPAVHGSDDRSHARAERGGIEHFRRVVGIHETEAVRRVFAGIAKVSGSLLERGGDVGRGGGRGNSPDQRGGANGVRTGHGSAVKECEAFDSAGHRDPRVWRAL